MRHICRTTLLFLTLAVMASAAAAKNPFYLTGKLSNNTLDGDLGAAFDSIVDGDDTGWGLGVGFTLGKYLAFQLEYHDLGSAAGIAASPCGPEDLCIELVVPVTADSTATSLSVLPHLPLGERFAVYGKFGIVSWESDVAALVGAAESFSADDEDLIYGAGLRLQLPIPFGIDVFAEYELIGDEFETLSLGATWGF